MAFGNATFTDAGSAVSDILGGEATSAGLRLKAQGDAVEGENYSLAADLADQNAKFSETSTAVKLVAADRAIYKGLGTEKTQIAGAGFEASGSAIDLLRSSAQQGAIQKQLVNEQGQITTAGYNEQAQSYRNLATYASMASSADSDAAGTAGRNGWITGGIAAGAAVATLFV